MSQKYISRPNTSIIVEESKASSNVVRFLMAKERELEENGRELSKTACNFICTRCPRADKCENR